MSYQAQTWVDKTGIHQCKNGGELLVLIRVANHTNGEMRGCYASAETLAGECLMGESTVLKHLRRLKAGGVLVPGDPELVSHLRADRRPPVYDLAGGHEAGCPGKHSSDLTCETVTTGARFEHPHKPARATGARSEHPSKKPRSAGARSEHPSEETPVTGVQIDLSRVFKSSTNSCKELNSLFSLPAGAFGSRQSQPSQEREREAAAPEGAVPEPRSEQPTPGARVARRWAAERRARGVFTSPDRVASLAQEADALLAQGQPAERLEREVSVMADHPTWVSLVRHMESVRPAMATVGGPGARPSGPGEGLSAAARAILAQGSGL
ncbi:MULTISPECIES: helix-turn-helix domain-containing protein [unclassified Streptomyces]|uniref:helix-turn-helix domain-containing protein n=1 Tax=unclassified Streptomyces TaxID=2593676 RepID=UPI0035DFA792